MGKPLHLKILGHEIATIDVDRVKAADVAKDVADIVGILDGATPDDLAAVEADALKLLKAVHIQFGKRAGLTS